MKDFFNELSYKYEVRGTKVIHYLYFQSKQEILLKDFFNELSYIYEVRGTKVIHFLYFLSKQEIFYSRFTYKQISNMFRIQFCFDYSVQLSNFIPVSDVW